MTEQELHAFFVKQIRRRKNALHIDQREIARRAGINENTLSRYMTCQRKPTYDIVVRIAQALECPPSYLIDIDEKLE